MPQVYEIEHQPDETGSTNRRWRRRAPIWMFCADVRVVERAGTGECPMRWQRVRRTEGLAARESLGNARESFTLVTVTLCSRKGPTGNPLLS